jgi:hypothetical protein
LLLCGGLTTNEISFCTHLALLLRLPAIDHLPPELAVEVQLDRLFPVRMKVFL